MNPNPDIHALFLEYNDMFFDGKLCGCEVKWSSRMTLCAGICSFQPRSGFCSIRLSAPLLKLRPRSDLINTLLHEMIHAFVFVSSPVRDHDDHGPIFQSHMTRINAVARTNITVFHTFHQEVDSYRLHWWQCDGKCRSQRPYFGLVKRSMNRAPGPSDRWWADHQKNCGGTYTKIKEPPGYKKKGEKKNGKQKQKEKQKAKTDSGATPSVREFFPVIIPSSDEDEDKDDAASDNPTNKKRKRTPDITKPPTATAIPPNDGGTSHGQLSIPAGGTVVVVSRDDGEPEFLLVGDISALLQTAPKRPPREALDSTSVVDLTVADDDIEHTPTPQIANSRPAAAPTEIIEIDE
ncbi:TPA: hypothetical protein N0F65_009737 [Lagenidium giganteum]|uniref:SprT-like domain-containing protein n=1 Tax=Lagenidium giganteum TaxID=4803 RepID=A0AAV2YGN3_9STRA|nr:TPA: hypothetical protein N0F65_009737 [Lagenidium giganteum]